MWVDPTIYIMSSVQCQPGPVHFRIGFACSRLQLQGNMKLCQPFLGAVFPLQVLAFVSDTIYRQMKPDEARSHEKEMRMPGHDEPCEASRLTLLCNLLNKDLYNWYMQSRHGGTLACLLKGPRPVKAKCVSSSLIFLQFSTCFLRNNIWLD